MFSTGTLLSRRASLTLRHPSGMADLSCRAAPTASAAVRFEPLTEQASSRASRLSPATRSAHTRTRNSSAWIRISSPPSSARSSAAWSGGRTARYRSGRREALCSADRCGRPLCSFRVARKGSQPPLPHQNSLRRAPLLRKATSRPQNRSKINPQLRRLSLRSAAPSMMPCARRSRSPLRLLGEVRS